MAGLCEGGNEPSGSLKAIYRINDAIDKLNKDIDSIVTWTKKFHLNINPGKTQAIILGHKRQTDAVKHLDISPVKLFRCYLTPSSEPSVSRRYLNFAACCFLFCLPYDVVYYVWVLTVFVCYVFDCVHFFIVLLLAHGLYHGQCRLLFLGKNQYFRVCKHLTIYAVLHKVVVIVIVIVIVIIIIIIIITTTTIIIIVDLVFDYPQPFFRNLLIVEYSVGIIRD
ncbi:hypothetical protein ANN_25183 [Periplaneta americana]|uniref:Uncharacterized protein n=1 Tax=Periplaneta americana TaxID=6978 RepID=A0ABQ8S0Y8_PERAM|nr:hypothetical protein ANN_25183 [Periplaneta americana]